jgi:hypothetical protein
MTDLVGRTLDRLAASLPGQVSSPSDAGYAAATAIWSKLVGLVPRALGHCRLSNDAALAVRAPICPFSQYMPDPAGIPDACPRTGPASCIAARFAKVWPRLKLPGLRAGCPPRVTLEHAQLAALRSREASTAISPLSPDGLQTPARVLPERGPRCRFASRSSFSR